MTAWIRAIVLLSLFLVKTLCWQLQPISNSIRPSFAINSYQKTLESVTVLSPALKMRVSEYMDRRMSEFIVDPETQLLRYDYSEIINQYNQSLYVKGSETSKIGGIKQESLLIDMFKPAGWYKDTTTKLDSTIPVVPHPFSYAELKKYGLESLSDDVTNFGGPIAFGRMIGIDWVEPEIPKAPVDESLRPRTEVTFLLDMRGSLRLGNSLDEQLSLAEGMNMERVKEDLAEKESFQDSAAGNSNPALMEADYRDKYAKSEKRPATRLSDQQVFEQRQQILRERRNKISLSSLERAHVSLMCASGAIGFGRTSHELVDLGKFPGEVLPAFQLVFAALVIASIISSVSTVPISQSKGLNPAVWVLRSLMGGPSTVNEIRAVI